MTDNVEEIKANTEVTLKMDMGAFLSATIGELPPYSASFDDDIDWSPDPVVGAIIDRAGQIVAERLLNDTVSGYKQRVSERLHQQIDEALADMVAKELDKPFKPVDTYGEIQLRAESTSLREQIKKQVETTLAKGMIPDNNRGYSNSSVNGAVKKYIDTEIVNIINKDFKTAIDQAKANVVGKIKDAASQVIADTIAKGVK